MCIFAPMNQLKRCLVWLSRINHCMGFGIQSPRDYAFVRYVINEHWPYYAYSEFPVTDWLTDKLGKLYFRLANWRQPSTMEHDTYEYYFKAGHHSIVFTSDIDHVELARVDIELHEEYESLVQRANGSSLLVVEGIHRNWTRWHHIVRDERVGTTFDLYYCGIVFFDQDRYKHHYKINF